MAIKRDVTPGVYIKEPDSFPPSIVGVETAVPCFIGYTEKATDHDGCDLHLVPRRIESMAAFVQHYGAGYPTSYYLVAPGADGKVAIPAADRDLGEFTLGTKTCHLVAIGGGGFNLYNSMRLFYANGGGDCYVISCGVYGGMAQPPALSPDPIAAALDICKILVGPTMVAVPDAVLLAEDDFAGVAARMLLTCAEAGDRMALLDIRGADAPAPHDDWSPLIDAFRDAIRARADPEQWRFGAAYFPALETSIVAADEIDVSRFATDKGDDILKTCLAGADLTPRQATQKLIAALPGFDMVLAAIAASEGVLPPSGAIAGVWTADDARRGVWDAPANIALATVLRPMQKISDDQQVDLSQPVQGLGINPIRAFPGLGTLVWGAHTLDSNSLDWRYLQVSRTIFYIEQSVKGALEAMAFQPNAAPTWATAVSMIEAFLHGLWAAGGLIGTSAADAYRVQAGLGSTMTAQDLLDGVMRVQISLQLVRPAEYLGIALDQQMQGAA